MFLGGGGNPEHQEHLETSPLIITEEPRVYNSGKALVWIPTNRFWPSALRKLPEGGSRWEGEARPGYVPGIILFSLGLECKGIPEAGGLECSPEDIFQPSFLSNLPPAMSPSPSPDPLFACSAQGNLSSIKSKGGAQGDCRRGYKAPPLEAQIPHTACA